MAEFLGQFIGVRLNQNEVEVNLAESNTLGIFFPAGG
jgi:hypothetical protein